MRGVETARDGPVEKGGEREDKVSEGEVRGGRKREGREEKTCPST